MSELKQNKGLLHHHLYKKCSLIWYGIVFNFFPFIKLLLTYLFSIKRIRKHIKQKYFYDYKAGLLDRTHIMKCLIHMALIENKIPVIPPLILSRIHNDNAWIFPKWTKYYDMDNIQATIHNKDGKIISQQPIKICTEEKYIRRHWYNILYRRVYKNEKSLADILWTNQNHHELTLKEKNPNIFFYDKFIHLLEKRSIKQGKLQGHYIKIDNITLPCSKKVKKIADKVITQLGEYYVFQARRADTISKEILVNDLNKLTTPSTILKRIKQIIPHGSRLYIMTNEHNPDYYNTLKKHYCLVQFSDFPQLYKIINRHTPDNYFLYAIELQILKHAKLAIEAANTRHATIIYKYGKEMNQIEEKEKLKPQIILDQKKQYLNIMKANNTLE